MPSSKARILALCLVEGVTGKQWNVIARQVSDPGGLEALEAGHVGDNDPAAKKLRMALQPLPDLTYLQERAEQILLGADDAGADFASVLDAEYPDRLRTIRDRPPFIFFLGDLTVLTRPTVAVVGTRRANDTVLARSARVARELVEQGVTVASGMAAGVDSAAHQAALDAGGTTVAVMGTGINGCYPKDHVDLKRSIAESGAVLSQFLPDQPPGRHTFPMRNTITSGASAATVVVEATETSGARMQARIAAQQGRPVFLMSSLVESHDWAKKMVSEGLAEILTSTEDVLAVLAEPRPEPTQQSLI